MKSRGSVWRAAAVAMGLAAGVSLGAATPSAARVVYEGPAGGGASAVRGGELVSGPHGTAWKGPGGNEDSGAFHGVVVDLAAAGVGRLAQGTLEFWMQRDEVSSETPLTFVGGNFEVLSWVEVLWQEDTGPALAFGPGSDYPLWYGTYTDLNTGRVGQTRVVELGRGWARGSWVHVALTWGATARECAVYVDGRRLAAQVGGDFAMGRLMDDSRYLVLGSMPMTGTAAGPTSAGNILHSALGPVVVHDVALGEGALSGPRLGSVAAEKAAYGSGQEVVVTLRGSADQRASFDLEGVATGVGMAEVDDGVYVGKVVVPAGVSRSAALTGRLTEGGGGKSATLAGKAVVLDAEAPAAPQRVLATVPWAGEVEVTWTASASADADDYLVYRGEGRAPDLGGGAYAEVKGLKFVDTAVVAGLTYQYAVVAVDRAGNASAASEVVSAAPAAGEGPAIGAITVEPFGRPVKPGQVVTVSVSGQSGGQLTVDLGTLVQGLGLAEQGRTGRYVGSYTVTDADVGASKSLHRVVAHLADAYGASELAGPEVAVVGRDALNDHTAPVIASASHDGFQVAGFSGKLVAGDVLTVSLEGEPGGYASFSVSGVVAGVAMSESATAPGTYSGSYTVGWADEGQDAAVQVVLADEAGNESTLTAGRTVSLDTRVRLLVSAQQALLPADRQSSTRLLTKATDANGDEVSGHELALTLSTTEEYTGVVGGGRLEGREARLEDEDNVEVKWGGVTDSFGEVAASYTAGFAAKTALVVAKDLTTGDVGAGWLNTYVASTVAIELVPRAARGAEDRAILRLTAQPAWLTADGRSTSRLKAVLSDLAGNPLAGQRVSFALANDNGRLKVLRGGLTDERGLAEAEYRAGTLAGAVTVTAAASDYGVTAVVQIELRADAPAKVELVASAARLVAGERATLSVKVSDIHDNPNIAVPVSFALLEGAGNLSASSVLTDRFGEGQVTFTAGSRAGMAVVEARHTSRAPNEEELRRVYGTVFVPRLAERQERDRVQVAQWLAEPGDEVEAGQQLVVLEGSKGAWTLTAPAAGVFVREVKHRRDRVELGDTLGYVEIDEQVWQDEYRN